VLVDGVLLAGVVVVLGGVLLGDGSRVLGAVLGGPLLGEGLPATGGPFVAERVGDADVVSCGVDRVVALVADFADGASPDRLFRSVDRDPSGTVFATAN
jgi:hypothetical protein